MLFIRQYTEIAKTLHRSKLHLQHRAHDWLNYVDSCYRKIFCRKVSQAITSFCHRAFQQLPGDESEEPIARRARTAVHRMKNVDTDRLIGVLEPSPGEDLDDEIDKLVDTDLDEPTDKQKRELLKRHSGLPAKRARTSLAESWCQEKLDTMGRARDAVPSLRSTREADGSQTFISAENTCIQPSSWSRPCGNQRSGT